MDNFLGGLVLFGFTLFLFFHYAQRRAAPGLGSGARPGQGARRSRAASLVVAGAAVVLTLLTWVAILIVG